LDRKLQQRLVGILVLAAFVLLIAPVLLDAEGRIPEKITNIPPQPKRPDLSHIRIVESTEPQVEPLPTPAEAEAEAAEAVTEPDTPEITSTDTDLADKNSSAVKTRLWSVQVASFRDVKKASDFKDLLRAAKFETYVREKLLSDGSLFTQVFVGPVANKSDAEKLKSKIKDDFNEQGLIVRYRD